MPRNEALPSLRRLGEKLAGYGRAWVLAWAVIGTFLALAIALGPLEGVPHVQDEVVYELQARLLSEGKLWEEPRLPRAAHHYEFVINDGRRYGVFPNGWPAVLAVGKLFGASIVVNPLLHGVIVLLGAALAGSLAGRRASFVAAPLLALCPALVLQGASRMSHTLCAALMTWAAWLVFTREPSRNRALALGTAIGWILFTRPLDGVIVALVVSAFLVSRGVLARYRAALIPIALALGLIGLLNFLLTESAFVFPQTLWFARKEPATAASAWRYGAECNRLGFGPGHGCFPINGEIDHTLRRGLSFAWLNLTLAGRLWFGYWAVGLFGIVAFFRKETRTFTLVALCLWVALALAYAAYWYHGACYGARFHHTAAPLVVVTVAIGLAHLTTRARLPAALALFPLAVYLERFGGVVPELETYWGVDARLRGIERRWDRGPTLFLVVYGGGRPRVWHSLPNTSEPMQAYVATLRRGSWIEHPRGGLVEFAEYQPRLRDELVRRAGQRKVYVLVMHEPRELDYLIPLESLPPPEGSQVTDLPLPQKLPYYSAVFAGGESMQKYYED